MKSEVCVLLAVLATFACAFTLPEGEGIYKLDSSNLNTATEGDWLLILYAPWCPHCHSLLDDVPELASEIKAAKGNVKIGIIDADAEPAVQMQFSMHGFPSLYMVHNGEVYAYPDHIGRSVETLTNWVTKDYAKEEPVTGYKAPFGLLMRAFALYSAFAIGTYRFLEVYAEKLNIPPMWFFCGVAVILAVLVIVLMIVTSRCRRPAKKAPKKSAAAPAPKKNAAAAKKNDGAIAAPIVQRARAENPIEGAAVAETEKVKEQIEEAKKQQELRRRGAKQDQDGIREQQKNEQKKMKKAKKVNQQNRPTQQPSKH